MTIWIISTFLVGVVLGAYDFLIPKRKSKPRKCDHFINDKGEWEVKCE